MKTSFQFASLYVFGVLMLTAGCQSAGSGGMAVTDSGDVDAAASSEALHETAASIDRHAARLAEARWQEEVGNEHLARQSYKTILEQDSQSADALIGLARLDQTAGRADEAERNLKAALALQPDDVEVIRAVSQIYMSSNRWSEASEVLHAGLELQPHDKTLTFELAVLCAKLGQTQEALDHFTKVVGAAEAHYNLALVLYEDGQKQMAEKHLLQALLLKPDFPDAKTWLAEVTGERMVQYDVRQRDGDSPEPKPFSSAGRVQQAGGTDAAPAVALAASPAINPRLSRSIAPREETNGGGSPDVQPPNPQSIGMTAAQREQRENQLRGRESPR